MKHFALTAALATAVPTAALAETSAQPVMDPVFITQNATSSDDDLLAPLLFVAFVLAAMAAVAGGPIAVVGNASDARLKTDVTRVGTADNGLPLYHFRYLGQSQVWEGVMAQDVLAHTPQAVSELGGYYMVDYGKLGLEMRAVD
ncbi:tail fiber domain-containing protein [Maritimibacter fusiformis]|uniref:Tail fiber domain-containing protein n=1 Tax=Maritimibacter fusiformis TaxID=2603819 RepID=A0A5D0RLG5_9RHOB|nr:tail fiber domain-containing protein [Maritimibacter fusiformis]TYB81374.1 tail fiber domain-containing protein [Maritimibacter fusiformis]